MAAAAKRNAKDSDKANGNTKKVNEFMTLDDQPFSVVEDIDFRRLEEHIERRYTIPSRRYFLDVCLPKMYDSVATRVHELLV